ncbi:Penicillin-binding protein 1A [Planktothrix serta PCC 8927]|uniref:Penicillin-binding protein 1A n=1 Tax=Planktothrix serta PCC 8927 TaxID=671068 RepID=A0A7Z9BUB1_9CYAN|nr:penicillin-binding protein 1A [Planktothrix serta]VXD21491.1 Penicillin-binding protein 1A [Planktothrix serta PCC 8927]
MIIKTTDLPEPMEESQLPSRPKTDSAQSETEWETNPSTVSTQPVLTSSATVTEDEPDEDSSLSAPESKSSDQVWYRRTLDRLNSEWVKLRQSLTSEDKLGKRWYRRPRIWIGVGVISLGGGALGYGAWQWYLVDQSLPPVSVSGMASYSRDGTITIKATNGDILMQVGPATREKLRLKQIPEKLAQAFISTEDIRFYEHDGVDYQGIVRAIGSNLLAGGVVEGGSTITQQLARIVYLNQEHSLTRKLKEAMVSWKIEDQISKEDILERYLNLVYLGSGAYGVADAAYVYFSKSVNELTLSEMAMLAGLPPAPSQYSPLENPEAAKKRRNIVLQRMQDAKVITATEAQAAMQEPLNLKPSQPKRLLVKAPYFSSYVLKELPQYVSKEAMEAGGLMVETSLDVKWQEAAEKTVKDAVEIDGAGSNFSQAALVSIEAKTGEVKAMVGGYEYKDSEFNRVTQAQRQPGSTFKGLVYATAISAGFSPYDSYLDEPYKVDGYRPRNYGNKHSGWTSMSDALSRSINVIAVKVLVDVGFEPAIKMAKDMGIKSPLKPTYAMALGAYEVNLLELTNAYGTLADEGNYIPAHGIRRVLDKQGNIIYQAKFKPKRVLDKNSAAITTWMLEGVVNGGTGGPAALSDRQVAGKTGTSEEARDLWFIGYIPQAVTGIWLGNDNNDPTWGASSSAAYSWGEFMQKVVEGMPIQKFPKLPELEGRKGSIKAKPHEPNSIETGSKVAIEDGDPGQSSSGDGTYASNSETYDSGSYYNDNNGYSSDGYYDNSYSDGYSSEGGYSEETNNY